MTLLIHLSGIAKLRKVRSSDIANSYEIIYNVIKIFIERRNDMETTSYNGQHEAVWRVF